MATKGKTTGKKQQNRQATPKQKKAAKLIVENSRADVPKPTGEILAEAGYAQSIQDHPTRVTNSETFQALLQQYIPDDKLAATHTRLLDTRKIEHMTFPLGPEDEDDPNLSGSNPNQKNNLDGLPNINQRTTLTDQEIKDMLKEVNCTVRRIVHGETARHVYYWTHDANAQTKALELAYKMRGLLGKESGSPTLPGGTINFNLGANTYIKTP